MKIGRDHALGSVAALSLAAILVFLSPSATGVLESPDRSVANSVAMPGGIAVELTGDSGRNGVYFVPRGMALSTFLDLAGIGPDAPGLPSPAAGVLTTATTVRLDRNGTGIKTIPLSAPKRIALGIPVNINRSSLEDLVLVPGIGEKTAEGILKHRRLNGAFRSIDDLADVKGIKEKRLEKLRKYVCTGC